MDSVNIFNKYLPIFTAFLGAFLEYIFSNGKYRYENFRKEATESLKDFYSPIFHEMRHIKCNLNEHNKIELLSVFAKKYTSKDTNIFKSYNENLVDLFYRLDDELMNFENKNDYILLESLDKTFNCIYAKVEKEYWSLQKNLYRENLWYIKLNRMNPIFRFIMDVGSLFYDIMQFLLVCLGFVIYIKIFNKITGDTVLPSVITENLRGISIIIITMFMFAYITRLPYIITVMDLKRYNNIVTSEPNRL